MTLSLVTVALMGGACGGGGSETRDAGQAAPSRSDSPSPASSQRQSGNSSRTAWSRRKTLARIAGEILVIDDRRVSVDPATVTCGGDGAGSRRGRERVWESFTCIRPTVEGHGVAGPDVVFRVQPTGRRSFRITDHRLTRY